MYNKSTVRSHKDNLTSRLRILRGTELIPLNLDDLSISSKGSCILECSDIINNDSFRYIDLIVGVATKGEGVCEEPTVSVDINYKDGEEMHLVRETIGAINRQDIRLDNMVAIKQKGIEKLRITLTNKSDNFSLNISYLNLSTVE